MFAIRFAGLSADRAIEIIAAVKLDCGFIGEDFESAAGSWVVKFGGQFQVGGWIVQDEIMVVAVAKYQLLVVIVDALADGRWLAKIEWSAGDVAQFAGGNRARVDRGESAGVELEMMGQDGTAAGSSEIEIRVIGEIEDRSLVCG